MFLVALFIRITAYGQACTGTFIGQVKDEQNLPLIGAAIFLLPQEQGTTSDYLGNFRFDKLCSGTYKVKIQYLGYETLEFDITIDGAVTKVVHLKEDVRQLREVVIKDEALDTEHAHNTARLSEKQLAESAGKPLGESLKEITGVNSVQTGPGIFKPVIHGVHSQRVLILNHGIRQEGQQWGAEHAPEIDPFIASNVVVIKDASSIKYGTDALGGVIVVNPAPLPEKAGLGGTLNTIYQSNGRSGTVSGMLEGGVKNLDGLGWRVQGTAKRTGDFHTPDYVLTNTGIKEIDFSAALGYHKKSLGIEAFFSHFQTELGILKGTSVSNQEDLAIAMEREPPQYTADFSYDISEPYQDVSHNLVKLNVHQEGQRNNFRIQYGFQNNNRKEFDFRVGVPAGTPSIDLKLNTHTLEAEWETHASDKRSLCLGVTGMIQDNNNIFGTQRIPFIPNFNNQSAGLFAIAKLNLKRWTADFGARYDLRHYDVAGYDFKNTLFKSDLLFHNVSATAGATRQLKHNQSLSLSLSSAWRPPSVAELYSLGTHQSVAAIEYGLLLNDSTSEIMDIKDVPFKTEQAFKAVSTYQRQWKHLQVEASVYANYIFNYIYLRPIGIAKTLRGPLPYYRYTQTDALFLGLDLSAIWQVNAHFKITPKASLLRASDESNHDYLIFIPSNRFEIGTRYEKESLFSFKNFFLESKIKYTAKQYRAPKRIVTARQFNEASEQNTNPFSEDATMFDFMAAPQGYWLWNLSTGISIYGNKVRYDFRVAAENVLNTSYREYTNRFRYYADDLGRNFIISIKCSF